MLLSTRFLIVGMCRQCNLSLRILQIHLPTTFQFTKTWFSNSSWIYLVSIESEKVFLNIALKSSINIEKYNLTSKNTKERVLNNCYMQQCCVVNLKDFGPIVFFILTYQTILLSSIKLCCIFYSFKYPNGEHNKWGTLYRGSGKKPY